MNTEADFLAALKASPGDALLVSAFADFLEERGDPRAAWVRDDLVRPWMGDDFADPVPALLDAIRRNRRASAARQALRRVGEAAVGPLVGLLGHTKGGVRERAAAALGAMGDAARAAVPELLRLLGDKRYLVRLEAAKALLAAKPDRSTDVAPVAAALGDASQQLARVLRRLLRWLKADGDVMAGLTAQAREGDAASRAAAVRTLAVARASGVLSLLGAALGDADALVRLGAVEALAVYTVEPQATALLLRASEDADEGVRLRAVRAVEVTGDSAAVTLAAARWARDMSAAVRSEAASRFGSLLGVADLLRLAVEDDESVAAAAVAALALRPSLPPDAEPVLLGLLGRAGSGGVRLDLVVEACGNCASATPTFIDSLRGLLAEGRIRYTAAEALGRLGPAATSAVGDLLELVRRTEGHLAVAASAAVLRINTPEGDAAFMDIVRSHDDGPDLLAALDGQRRRLPLVAGDVPRLLDYVESAGRTHVARSEALLALSFHPGLLRPHHDRLAAILRRPLWSIVARDHLWRIRSQSWDDE